MGTIKLYYDDPKLLEAEAELIGERRRGDRWAVLLDRTLLFPGGGGQPADAGWIDGVPVAAMEVEGDEILHLLDAPLPSGGGGRRVKLRLDASRRLESAQQHTGQHIVSACLQRRGFQTVSVHMGELAMTIESPVATLPEDEIREVERCANAVICSNLPVRTHLVTAEELTTFDLRREPGQRDLYRIVEIEGHDASACGGVHVGRTGEVGLVKWTGSERIRGNTRTSWLVGERAYRDYARKTELLRELGTELSAPPEELPQALRRLKAELAALAERLEAQELRAAASEAERLVARSTAEQGSGVRVIVERYTSVGRGFLRALGAELSARQGTVALLASVEGERAELLACRSADVALDLVAALKPCLAQAGGTGGGRGASWQGVAREAAGLDGLLRSARSALRPSG